MAILKELNYQADSGFGLIFPVKTFIISNDEFTFVISPGPIKKEDLKDYKNIHFIAPNGFHHGHLKHCKEIFPDAKFFGPKRASSQAKVPLLKMSELRENELLNFCFIKGHKLLSETCFYYKPSKTLIITDLIFNLNHEMSIMTRFWLTLAGAYKKIATSRLLQLGIDNKSEFYKSLESLLNFPFEKVLLSHGDELTREQYIEHISQIKKKLKLD